MQNSYSEAPRKKVGFGSNDESHKILSHLKSQLEDWNKVRQRWEVDWERAYNRVHNTDIIEYNETDRDESWQSKQVIPLTRNKRRIALALIESTLFPNGEFPFSLDSTPRPDSEETKVFQQGFGIPSEDRVGPMQRIIKDQLVESGARKELRRAIRDMVDYGTCVMKGPIEHWKDINRWEPEIPEDIQIPEILPPSSDNPEENEIAKESLSQAYAVVNENIEWSLVYEKAVTIQAKHVDIWDAWIDPNADSAYEGVGCYERALMTSGDIASLADVNDSDGNPVYNNEEIERLLESPDRSNRSNRSSKSNDSFSLGPHRTPLNDASKDEEYEVFTYAGKVSAKDFVDKSEWEALFEDGAVSENSSSNIDMNRTINVIAVFCKNSLLSIRKIDSRLGLRMYYSANYIEASGGPYGYGLPWEMEQSSSFANKMVRMFEDNVRIASCPPSTINYRRLKNPTEKMRPGARFETKDGSSASDIIDYARVPNVAPVSFEAMKAAEDLAHMASGIPQFLEGDVLGHKAQTAYEASELKKSAMGQLGRVFQNIDDTIITPMIEGFYDWNMDQAAHGNAPKSIMGDFSIIARGFSSFQNKIEAMATISEAVQISLSNPEAAKYIKTQELLTEYYERKGLDVKRFMRTEQEVMDMEEAQAQSIAQAQQAALEQERQKIEIDAMRIQGHLEAKSRDTDIKEAEAMRRAEKDAADMQLRKEELDLRALTEASKEEGRRVGHMVSQNRNTSRRSNT